MGYQIDTRTQENQRAGLVSATPNFINEIADYCYRKLSEGREVIIEGKLNTKLEIIVINIIEYKK